MKLLLLTLAALLLLSQLTPGYCEWYINRHRNASISDSTDCRKGPKYIQEGRMCKGPKYIQEGRMWATWPFPFQMGNLCTDFQNGYTGDAQKCWNLHGKCRHRCSRKESVYVYCTNGKMCCVKPKYQPKPKPWMF